MGCPVLQGTKWIANRFSNLKSMTITLTMMTTMMTTRMIIIIIHIPLQMGELVRADVDSPMPPRSQPILIEAAMIFGHQDWFLATKIDFWPRRWLRLPPILMEAAVIFFSSWLLWRRKAWQLNNWSLCRLYIFSLFWPSNQMKDSVPSEFNLAALLIFQPVLEYGVQLVIECPPPAAMETISKQGSKV